MPVLASIGAKAFYYCTSLMDCTISAVPNLVNIESEAFRNCSILADCDLSAAASLVNIKSYAFYACVKLEVVNLSALDHLQSIETYAFYNTPLLHEDLEYSPVDVGQAGLKMLTTIGDYAFRSSGVTSLKMAATPRPVTIGISAFQSAGALAEVDFHSSSLKSIAVGAFQSCSAFETVDLSDCAALTSIGASAFQSSFKSAGTNNLADISGCTALTAMGASVFASSNVAVADFTGSNKLTAIPASAFLSCLKLDTVTASGCSLLKTLGVSSFQLSGIQTVNLDGTIVESIGNLAFASCSKLASFEVYEISATLKAIGDNAFKSCALLTKADMSKCTQPLTIGVSAFESCTALTFISFPPSLTEVKDTAFYLCGGLENIWINVSDPASKTWGDRIFTNIYVGFRLHVPGGARVAWRSFWNLTLSSGATLYGGAGHPEWTLDDPLWDNDYDHILEHVPADFVTTIAAGNF
jgi:hypothetical protein